MSRDRRPAQKGEDAGSAAGRGELALDQARHLRERGELGQGLAVGDLDLELSLEEADELDERERIDEAGREEISIGGHGGRAVADLDAELLAQVAADLLVHGLDRVSGAARTVKAAAAAGLVRWARVADEAEADGRRDWATALALVVGLAVLAVAALAARVFMALVVREAPPTLADYASGSTRVGVFADALPSIAATDGPTGMVFGTSLAFFALSPATFDEELRRRGVEMTTFTAATPMMAPSVERALAERIEGTYAKRGRRLDLALPEFTPHNMTEATARGSEGFRRAELRDLAEVLDASRMRDLALQSPDDAAHVLALAALGNQDPNVVNSVLGRMFLMTAEEREAHRRQAGPQAALQRGLSKLFGGPYPAWNLRARGEPRWLYPETAPAYRNLVLGFNASKPRHRARLVATNDADELHIDRRRLDEFIALVRELQSFTDYVVVWLAPRNTDWVRPTPEGLERLNAALAEVHRATDAPIIDLTIMDDIDPSDFIDATHLSEHSGRPKLSKRLADEVADAMKRLDKAPPP